MDKKVICEHVEVSCVNPYSLIRKYKCLDCGEVMMCSCDKEIGTKCFSHQLRQDHDIETKEVVYVSLGFVDRVCNTCRGKGEIAYPRQIQRGSNTKFKRYYWREINLETARRFIDYVEEKYGEKDWLQSMLKRKEEYAQINKQVEEELRIFYKNNPKYIYVDELTFPEIKEKYHLEIVDAKVEYSNSHVGGKSLVKNPDGTNCFVEEYVANKYEKEGYSVIKTESRPFHVIFSVFLFLEIESALDPKARLSGFGERAAYEKGESKFIQMFLPEDFGTRHFYQRKKDKLDKLIEEIPDEIEDLLWLFDYWVNASFNLRNYLWAHKQEDIDKARELIQILPRDVLKRILYYLIDGYWDRYLGWPDLFVYRDKEYFFVEVKSSSDKLSSDQINWLKGNDQYLKLPFKIFKLHKKYSNKNNSNFLELLSHS